MSTLEYRKRPGQAWNVEFTDADGGGGSGSGVTVLGPATVSFDDDNLNNQVKAFDIAAGTIVLQVWAFIDTVWDSSVSNQMGIGVGPSDWDDGNWWTLLNLNCQVPKEFDAEAGVSAGGIVNTPPGPANYPRVGFVNEDGAVVVSVSVGGDPPTQGQARVFALVLAP